jgi:hypothetical protein
MELHRNKQKKIKPIQQFLLDRKRNKKARATYNYCAAKAKNLSPFFSNPKKYKTLF